MDALTNYQMDTHTYDRHNAMTIASWPSASGAKIYSGFSDTGTPDLFGQESVRGLTKTFI